MPRPRQQGTVWCHFDFIYYLSTARGYCFINFPYKNINDWVMLWGCCNLSYHTYSFDKYTQGPSLWLQMFYQFNIWFFAFFFLVFQATFIWKRTFYPLCFIVNSTRLSLCVSSVHQIHEIYSAVVPHEAIDTQSESERERERVRVADKVSTLK